jgi:phage repressor protein C with HTH and peptisase S24 domain
MENWHTRLAKAIELRGTTGASLAKATGNKPASISDWLSGKTKMMGGENALKTCAFLRINQEWLFFGKGLSGLEIDVKSGTAIAKTPVGAKEESQNFQFERFVVTSLDDNNDDYPYIKRVSLKLSAGITGFGVEMDIEDKTPIVMQKGWFSKRGYVPEKLLAVTVAGQSMEPGLYDGDTVVINTADTKPADGEAFAINYEGELLIKRLVRDNGLWWLSSDNSDQRKFPRKQCEGDVCLIIGKIVHKQSERI